MIYNNQHNTNKIYRMKKKLVFIVFMVCLSVTNYGQIIADHNVVDDFDQIPDFYINEVKKMLVEMAGESHSTTYLMGSNLLESLDQTYQSKYWHTTPPSETSERLRIGKTVNTGEADYFSNTEGMENYKNRISTQNNTGNEYDVMAFVWCWDMYYDPIPGGGLDLEHHVHWGGTIEGGPERESGVKRWGLDAEDQQLTDNSICMDTYLNAVEEYQQYCIDNGWGTKIIYTTGPVDDDYPNSEGREDGFQRELKHNYIREHVSKDPNSILFDYADILCWNNDGEKYEGVWNDGGELRSHAHIHPDNNMDYDASWNIIAQENDGDHIGEVGSLRLMKAMWWMLARIAGWEGVTTDNHVVENEKGLKKKISLRISDNNIIVDFKDCEVYNKISLIGLKGEVITSKDIDGNIIQIDISPVSSGIYIIKCTGIEKKAIKVVI